MSRLHSSIVAAVTIAFVSGCGTPVSSLGAPTTPRQMLDYGIGLENAGSLVAAYNLYVQSIVGSDSAASNDTIARVKSSTQLMVLAEKSIDPSLESLIPRQGKDDAVRTLLKQSDATALKRIKGFTDQQMVQFLNTRFDEIEQRRERERAERRALLVDMVERQRMGSKFICRDDIECKKAFSIAQIYVNQNSDMKIQLATDTIVETYNPTEDHKIGLRIIKLPLSGSSSEISIETICKLCNLLDAGLDNPVAQKAISIKTEFSGFITARLR